MAMTEQERLAWTPKPRPLDPRNPRDARVLADFQQLVTDVETRKAEERAAARVRDTA